MKKNRARPRDKAEEKALPGAASSRPFLHHLVSAEMVCSTLVMVVEMTLVA
jgi:hypothetical protein